MAAVDEAGRLEQLAKRLEEDSQRLDSGEKRAIAKLTRQAASDIRGALERSDLTAAKGRAAGLKADLGRILDPGGTRSFGDEDEAGAQSPGTSGSEWKPIVQELADYLAEVL